MLSVLIESLRAIGYQVTTTKLQAAQYGVPQNRRRYVVVEYFIYQLF